MVRPHDTLCDPCALGVDLAMRTDILPSARGAPIRGGGFEDEQSLHETVVAVVDGYSVGGDLVAELWAEPPRRPYRSAIARALRAIADLLD